MAPIPNRPPDRRGSRPRGVAMLRFVLGLTPLLAALLIWQLVGSDSSALLPRPSAWWDGWNVLVSNGQLRASLVATLWTFVLALSVAVCLGACLGALIGSSRWADRSSSPLIAFLMSIPPAAVIPVATLVFGIGIGIRLGTIVFAAIWPILLNTVAAMRAVPAVRLEAARSLGLTRLARYTRVVLPSLVPGVMVGVLIAAPIALIVTLVVEMLTSTPGLGYLILQSQRNYQAPQVFAMLVVIGILGVLLNAAVATLEKRLMRNWPRRGN